MQDNPDDDAISAMCYEMSMESQRIEYFCPVCKEKTLYTDDFNSEILLNLFIIEDTLNSIECKDITLTLDESAFCKNCSPHIDDPRLHLSVKHNNKPETVINNPVTMDDITLLADYFAGREFHLEFDGSQTPLNMYTSRIEVLLGIKFKPKL